MPRVRDPDEPKIYFLPNLMTACNLACGFFAVLMIFRGLLEVGNTKIPPKEYYEHVKPYYEYAILLIFGSCLFDLLDGRLARLGGQESPFGQEFDSLADIISFGMAPAMLLSKAVLFPLGNIGWAIALLYLVCGAMRLARFNCLASMPKKPGASTDFRGLPIPMAAGFIASLTFLLIDLHKNDHELGFWKYVLAGAMLGLSLLMISDIRYPSFKKVGWRTRGTLGTIIIAVLLVFITVQFRYVMPVVLFSVYLVYGMIRPWISQRMRKEIEVDSDTLDDPARRSFEPRGLMTAAPPRRSKWVTLLLVILPIWLIASGAVAVWFAHHREKEQAKVEQQRFAQTVSVPMIADDLKKLVGIIGERNGASETAAKNLTRTASMIEGLLGPGNTGYTVRRERGPADWPLIHVTLGGKNPEQPAVWVLSSYDSRPGSPGAEANATGLAATLAAAQAMANDTPAVNVHFVFLPHANDPESPVLETAAKFREMADSPKAVLCVEAMGAGEQLWLSSRDTAAPPLSLAHGLGTVRGAETVCLGEDVDLASVLFEMGLPAVRVGTRPMLTPDEPDDQSPSAPTVAASAGRLVELIRRCAAAP